MKLICATFGLAAICAVGLDAQSQTTTSQTNVKVGTDITVSGCLTANPGGGYLLTTKDGALKYALDANDDLATHVGHQVELKSTATDPGGNVKIQSATPAADKSTTKLAIPIRFLPVQGVARQRQGAVVAGTHYLGTLKMISTSCS
jgi:hypothetical protein